MNEYLRTYPYFCLWKYIDGRKVPFSPKGGAARSNDPSTFDTYANTAPQATGEYQLGVGLFGDLSAIDIDDCIQDGKISDKALDILQAVPSYAEISPSGTGVHILFLKTSSFDKSKYYLKNEKEKVEIYVGGDTNRFMTLTGKHIDGTPDNVVACDIQYVLDRYMLRPAIGAGLSLWLAKDAKLADLWNGAAPGAGADESERDEALCCKLAYYCGADADKVDEMFRQSPYYASKDDEHKAKWERDDYRVATISKACDIAKPHLTQGTLAPSRKYTADDTGNSRRFIDTYGQDLRWNTDAQQWMVWNGKYWQIDVDSIATLNKLDAMADTMMSELTDDSTKDERRNVAYLRSHRGKQSCLSEAQHLGGVSVSNAMFDRDAWMLCTDSGAVDLRTGAVRPSTRDDMFSKTTGCPIDMDAVPVKFVKFLKEITKNHPELFDYVHRLFGYGCTASTREQQIYFFVGDGNDGKSLLLDVVGGAIGDYTQTAKASLLTEQYNKNNSETQVAMLKDARFVSVEETKLGDALDEGIVKNLTSGVSKMVGRFLFQNEFSFYMKAKIFMATNYRPTIYGTDNGIRRRLVLIPFDRGFSKDEVNKDMREELETEKPEILGWLVEGCMEYLKQGLNPPECVDDLTQDYLTEQDRVSQWIGDRCDTRDPNAVSTSTELYRDYRGWCAENGEHSTSQTMFGRNLAAKFRKIRLAGSRVYCGIKIRGDVADLSKARIAMKIAEMPDDDTGDVGIDEEKD